MHISRERKEKRKTKEKTKKPLWVVVTSQYYKEIGVVGSLLLTATSFCLSFVAKGPPLYQTFCAVQTPTCSIIFL
jgi:hypothetical protein